MTKAEYNRAYHIANRDKQLARMREYRLARRDVVLKREREYSREHYVQRAAYRVGWSKANPERSIFYDMRRRCNNPDRENYRDYGARGIKCLYASFAEFLKDVGKRPNSSYSIDRIDNEGNYEPGNCRWATAEQQANNRRLKC